MKSKYSKKYLDPKWQKFRLQVFERDNFKCVRCNSSEHTLHAHHTFYHDVDADPWDYNLESVLTLCEYCHAEEHRHVKSANYQLMQSLNATGISYKDKIKLMTAFSIVRDKLPEDYWDVVVLFFMDFRFYEIAKKLLYAENQEEIVSVVADLTDQNVKFFLMDEFGIDEFLPFE